MRIGIDARFYGGEQSKGLGRYVQKLIENLTSRDQKNEYVIFLQEPAFRRWHFTNKNFTPILAPYRWYTFAEQIFMPWLIRRAKVDFMHFPHFNVPLLYRRPFIVTVHDLIINHFPTDRATTLGPILYKVKQFAGRLVMQHAIKHAWRVITVSAHSKQDIVNMYQISPDKIVVTYEAAEAMSSTSATPDKPAKILSKYKISPPYFLYVGNAYPHKNLEFLLDAWKRVAKKYSWQLVLVGQEDYFYQRLKQAAWSRDVDASVIFPGFIPDAELPYLYQQALAYIFPSLYEGFGLPPLEAMVYHTPVLAARTSCLPEILSDAALYFEPQDISGIIRAMEKVAFDEPVRQNLIANGKKQLNKYSWRKMTTQTLAIYEQFIQEKS